MTLHSAYRIILVLLINVDSSEYDTTFCIDVNIPREMGNSKGVIHRSGRNSDQTNPDIFMQVADTTEKNKDDQMKNTGRLEHKIQLWISLIVRCIERC